MNKFLKIIVLSACAAAGLLLAAKLVLILLFPPVKLRQMIKDGIRQQLGREAQIGGARIGLRGLSLDRIKVFDAAPFAADALLEVDHVRVRWALFPLLTMKVFVKEVFLEKPRIHLIRLADGKTFNVSGLLRPPSAGAAAKTSSGPAKKQEPAAGPKAAPGVTPEIPWALRVRQIHLRGGTVRMDDRSPARQDLTLSDVSLMLHDFDSTKVQGSLLVGQLAHPMYTAQDISADWNLQNIERSFSRLSGWLRIQQGTGVIEDLHVMAGMSPALKMALTPLLVHQSAERLKIIRVGLPDLRQLRISQIDGDFTLNTGTMTIGKFEVLCPQVTLTATGTLQAANGVLSVDIELNSPKPVLMGEMNLKMRLSGTLANPRTDLISLKKKAFKATLESLLNRPNARKEIHDAPDPTGR